MPSPHLRIPRRKPQPEFRHRHHSKTISVYVPVPALLSTSVSCVCISVDVRVCASIYACDCVCACLCLRLCLWLWLCPRLRWLVWLWNSGLRMRAFWENLVISLSWGCHACGRSSLLAHAVENLDGSPELFASRLAHFLYRDLTRHNSYMNPTSRVSRTTKRKSTIKQLVWVKIPCSFIPILFQGENNDGRICTETTGSSISLTQTQCTQCGALI